MTNRRFGTFKFGSGTLFGNSDTVNALAYGLEVDWENDGGFDGTNEADRMIGYSITRGRQHFLKPNGEGFEPLQAGRMQVELDNHDGRYNGWNDNSPLYPNVTYGRDVRLKVRDMSASEAVDNVFYGTIYDIKTSGYGQDAKVTLYIQDGLAYLQNYAARVAVQNNIVPSDAVDLILDYVGWPARWGRNLDITTDNIKYFWADGNKVAKSVINDIVDSYAGQFYIASNGNARYLVRTNTNDCDVELSQDELLKDIGLPQPFENHRNITRIKSHPRTVATTGVIWQLLGNAPSILNGESQIIWANYTYDNQKTAASSVITPAATTDYTMNTQADGGGTDKTADCTVAITDFGDTAKLTVTNNSGGTIYVTKLQVRGDAIYEANNVDITYPADTSSITAPRELFLDLPWMQDLNVAKDFSDLIGQFFSTLHPYPVVRIENRYNEQFVPDLFDIITLSIGKLGISGESYRVAGIEHSTSENCQAVETIYYLEPYISFENFWIFPITDFGTDTVFGA